MEPQEPLDDKTIEQLEELGVNVDDPEQVKRGLKLLEDLADDRTSFDKD